MKKLRKGQTVTLYNCFRDGYIGQGDCRRAGLEICSNCKGQQAITLQVLSTSMMKPPKGNGK